MKKIIPLLLALALAACGGGGGGSSGQPPRQTGLLDVTFSTSSLNFEYTEGEEPRSQTMSASASGTTDKDVLVGAEVSGTGIATPISVVLNPATQTASITVTPARGLKAGTYNGIIKMMACTSQSCTQQHNGSPYNVAYTVTVKPPEKPVLAKMVYNATSLSLDYDEGKTPASKTFMAQATGATNRNVYMRADVTGSGLALPIQQSVDAATNTATFTVSGAYGMKAGVYSGTIKLTACADTDCSLQHQNSPYSLPYTVTVRPPLKAAQTALSLAAPETGSSPVTQVALTLPSPGATVSTAVAYDGARSGWLSTQVSGSTLNVQALAQTLSAGTYTATVSVSLADKSQTVSLPVTLTVGSGLTVAENAALKIDSGTTLQELQGTIALAMAPGATATQWTASSNQSWLKLDQATGPINTQPTWRIDPAAFGPLANNQHYIAVVTIATDAALPQKTYTLDVQKALASVTGLDSLALLAGQGGDVLVYGNGFDKLPADGVTVAGAQPTAVTVLSPQVMRLTMPPLSAGAYAVSLKSVAGLANPGKSIQVTARDTYNYQALDTKGQKAAIVWDAVSKSAFVVNRTLKSVMRYVPVNGNFQLAGTRSFEFVDSIAMNPDHSALIVRSGTYKVYKLSPTDLSTMATVNLGTSNMSYESNLWVPLPITGDNRIQYRSNWYDLDTGAETPVALNSYFFSQADWSAVSGNGMRVLWPDSGMSSTRNPILWMDLIGGKFTSFGYSDTNAPFFYDYTVNHDGSKWFFNGKVVDFELKVLGGIETPANWTGNKYVFSRDGSRLYFYGQNTSTVSAKPRIYVYDTSTPVTTTVNFPLLGYIEFDDLPNCPYNPNGGAASDNCYTFSTGMTITDDDQTLLLAGDAKFVAVPVPLAMRASVSSVVRQARHILGGQTVIPAARR